MTIRMQVMSGLRWTAGARLLAQAITWGITVIVIRVLSPIDYGLLAMATVFIAFASMFSDFGLGTAVVQQRDIDVDTLKKVFGVLIAVNISLACLLSVSAPIIAAFFNESRLVPLVRVLSIQFVLAAFAIIPDAMLQRRMEFRRRSLLDLAGVILGSSVTLWLALAGFGVWALVFGALLTQAWKTAGINILAPFLHWPKLSLTGLRSLTKFGAHLTASQILWFFFTQVDVIIAGKWLGKEALGFYSVAMHVSSLPNQRLAGIINQVAFPAFSRIQHDMAAVGRHLLLGVRMLSLIAFAAVWGISCVAPEIVAVLLSSRWAPAALPLQVIGLVMPLRMISNFVPNALQGIGRADILLWNGIWASLIAPIALLVGVNWGLLGLSLAWLVWVPLVFFQNMLRSLPVFGLDMWQLAGAIVPAAGAGVVMYSAVSITRLAFVNHLKGPLQLAVLILVGAAAYIVASCLINRKGVRDVFELTRSLSTTRRSPS